ncbi:1,4-dihydroxy-2-naphthoate octaprenyltransferase [Propionibacterium sp. oral taxon 192 str. F0372]|uniref:1,4-dihydroxy-2-naphthoate polyprenyltransferase n=1 Tax=Propionibacterium sp. oral taxon 192 TaxID=671222 RepID=UPI000353D02F|nr:1,4-dihydroxy-2-naphthoate polyprenyltransferase [Propionibacterium sp. oral taxon 192]EPH07212.1 1,4-dihydroxy-2-naphthoate octaprenyltransferase [Propionibacterium sp. oral taxon 192 str. F0372]
MASVAEWVEGARLRTLPAAIAPVFAGSAVAIGHDGFVLVRALLAMGVGLALQIGVNYANDYSDGIRGTDEYRVGPQRLVGSGAAAPAQVKRAAFGCFGIAMVLGSGLVVLSGQWWWLAIGVACVLAAWYYTGGRNPYGYRGLGEVFVFIFFGLAATCGTTWTQLGELPAITWATATAMGLMACQVLVCNNLRDIPTDTKAGKCTLETMLGDGNSRLLYLVLGIVAVMCLVAHAVVMGWWTLLGLGALVFLVPAIRNVLSGAMGMALVRTLKLTGFAELAAGIGLYAGALIGA